jgi:lysophospholipase L1-like esterase
MSRVKRIVFAGDSLTDGSAWPDWVIETLKANDHPNLVKLDAGVAGDDVPRLKARFQHDVLDLKPDLVIFNIGTNDREPVEEYRRDVGEMVKQLRQAGARVLLCIPPGICDPKDPTRDARVVAYGEALRELAKTHDCAVADLHAAFAGGTRAASRAEAMAISDPGVTPALAAKTSRVLWGPDGVHHTINGWRTMGRAVLAALGCQATMVEKVSLYPHALTEWFISPPIPWKHTPRKQWTTKPPDFDPTAAEKDEYPPLPEIPGGFDPFATGWRKFDRAAEVKKTSWWQVSWLERGGVMPMGQEIAKDNPGAPSGEAGAFALAIVKADRETRTTMHVGGSCPYAVWLNRNLVWNGNFLHGYHPDADRFPVTLRKGENHILVFTNWLLYVSLGEK